jgi:hypothetical protein
MSTYTDRIAKRNRLGSRLAAGILAIGASLGAVSTQANDINIHPAACQAPFLDQARPMRWHEHYIFNPLSNSLATFVICPATYDNDVVNFPSGGSSFVRVDGATQNGAPSQAPACFFAAADRENLDLDPYVNTPGGARTFIQPLGTSLTFPRWFSQASISHDGIAAALGSSDPTFWNVAIFCQLPLGYGISNLVIEQ